MLVASILGIFLLAHTASAMQCIHCRNDDILVSESSPSNANDLREALGLHEADPYCEDHPDMVEKTKNCDVCATMMTSFEFNYEGEEIEFRRVIRGCAPPHVNASVIGDMWCERGELMNKVEELLHMLKPEKSKQSSNESGNDRVTGLCYCTGHDSCNDMTEVEILDELTPDTCKTCTWTTMPQSDTKTDLKAILPNLSNKCTGDGASAPTEECDPGQRCASALLDITRFEGVSGITGMIFARGCVNRGDSSGHGTTCHMADDYQDQTGQLLNSTDYDLTSGSICFCDSDHCNCDDKELMQAAADVEPMMCYSCRHVHVHRGEETHMDDFKMELGTENWECAEDPDSLVANVSCETCATNSLDVDVLFRGHHFGVSIFTRGCARRAVPDEALGCSSARMEDLERAIGGLKGVMGEEVLNLRPHSCMCRDFDGCNNDTMSKPLMCHQCTWASGGKKEDEDITKKLDGANIRCRTNPNKVKKVECGEDEVCGTSEINVARINGKKRPTTLYHRGCLPKFAENGKRNSGCKNIRKETKNYIKDIFSGPFGKMGKIGGRMCFF